MFNAVCKRHLSALRLIKVLEQYYTTAERFPIALAMVVFTQVQVTATATNDTTHTVIIKHTVIKPVRTAIILSPHSVPSLP